MFIDEKTLCGSTTKSFLQKPGCKSEPPIMGEQCKQAPGLRLGETQTVNESHTWQRAGGRSGKIWESPGIPSA